MSGTHAHSRVTTLCFHQNERESAQALTTHHHFGFNTGRSLAAPSGPPRERQENRVTGRWELLR